MTELWKKELKEELCMWLCVIILLGIVVVIARMW